MHQVRHRRGSAVAFVAAAVLVLQSFLTAWAAGAMPVTPMLDAFGNPLCITSVDHDGDVPRDDHSKLPDCCTFGCNLASPLHAAEPAQGVGLLKPLSSTDVRFHVHKTFHIQSPDHDPGSSRAPPLTT
ncbi:hypothetical protein ACFOLL_17660 [Falsochrobactrum ovis]|uniref:hypothetical protein n=1 Tax=Falsochrobactrum ovis TaxID=1293442 RepID=UPI001AECEB10|nr:hypothetical protein [Falsochrobactrum ovis]